jgi:hypothetical protein
MSKETLIVEGVRDSLKGLDRKSHRSGGMDDIRWRYRRTVPKDAKGYYISLKLLKF